VYLHGRLDADDDLALGTLVLSSADFGQAYLTERWASRFITELFRRYKVLFIGYSADDPVMRYMLDAFAADRAMGESVASAFAFASARPREELKVAADWQSKGVRPIVYTIGEHGHERLHTTLKHWAERHTLGLQGKAAIIREHAYTPLIQSASEQVCWALRDPTGLAARTFALLSPAPPFEWLEQFQRAGLLGPASPPASTHDITIVSAGDQSSGPPLTDATNAIAVWSLRHLADPRLAEWVIGHGTCLHPLLRKLIRSTLADSASGAPISDGLRLFWSVASSEEYASCLNSSGDAFEVQHRLRTYGWNSALRREVIFAFTPYLRLGRTWKGSVEPQPPEYLSTYAEAEIHLRGGRHAFYLHDAIESRMDSDQILRSIAIDIARLLDRACDLLVTAEQASDGYDYSYIWCSSIEHNRQYPGPKQWICLVSLVFDAVLALSAAAPLRARAIIDGWRSSKIPLLRRFVFLIAARTALFAPFECVELLVGDDPDWLWSHAVEKEACTLLESCWPRLDETPSARLLNAILEGPRRSMFGADIGDEDYADFSNDVIATKLECLKRTARGLPTDAEQRLSELRPAQAGSRDAAHAPFRPVGLSVTTGVGIVDPLYEIRGRSLDEQIDTVADITLDSPYWASWRYTVHDDVGAAATVLIALADSSRWPMSAWKELILNLRTKDASAVWQRISRVLASAPDLGPLANELAWTLREILKFVSPTDRPSILTVWDRIAPIILEEPADLSGDKRFRALNGASGALAQILLDSIDAQLVSRPSD
jgi:hypothetical protein